MSYILLAVALVALAYQLVSLVAAVGHWARRDPAATRTPGVSILKPVRGLDPEFRRAIRSHAAQDYPEFEIVFGVTDAEDPAIGEIERLATEFPGAEIRVIRCQPDSPNHKVGTLAALAAEARHPILLVNDSDIVVPPGYLRQVVAPLEDAGVGMVTCLYRAEAARWPARLEALGIATDFAPSVLVAPLVGVREFGLGSTLVFRRAQLDAVGGFAAIADRLADDYELARRITGLGYRVHLSKIVVATALGAATWSEVWRHQVRWHRTIRVAKGGAAYAGLIVTQATFWALAAAAAGWWGVALATLAVRLAAGLAGGVAVLRDPITARWWWLMPVRDLFGTAVWAAALFGNTVEWRGRRLRLSTDGRITGTTSR